MNGVKGYERCEKSDGMAKWKGGGQEVTKRKYLKNGNRGKVLIDMEKVYRQLDGGRSIESVAKEWGVSVSTLYRRHREYQKEVDALEKKERTLTEELPPIPGDML